MNPRTIKKVLRRKLNDWIKSIEDNEPLQKMVQQDAIITGGCITSMLLDEEVNDFDIYFATKTTAKAVAEYYVSRFEQKRKQGIATKIYVVEEADRIKIVVKSAGIASEEGTNLPYDYFEASPGDQAGDYVAEVMEGVSDDPGEIQELYDEFKKTALDAKGTSKGTKYRPVFLSTNAITLSDQVQLVIRFFGTPEDIHSNYDFVHCTNYWTLDGDLVLRKEALQCILTKELYYVGSKYPLASLFRMRKFIERGWIIHAGQVLKIAMQVAALDLTNIEVLKEQLIGVDAAYFVELLTELEKQSSERINHIYLVEIIDRLM